MISRGVVRLTIDTETDSYEQAIAAVQAAYGLRPVVPGTWPPVPAPDARPDPRDLDTDDLGDGWTDQLLFRTVAARTPGARAELRRITEMGGTALATDQGYPRPARKGGRMHGLVALEATATCAPRPTRRAGSTARR